ncbi:PepSY domain-containing protein [Streptomyces sp. ISL-86]|uniref:PepSY domain-containing protein n=1 Tax=Streptomyces sp. ISL-86 TaxID=2819187 RepID=UPI001BEB1E05|nr:PepSY domain-containing protein [Streptomyces sp. ISL-86]MBT2459305.1 PepSY domain-containing protein [Streptomyces sp. ISL-86]
MKRTVYISTAAAVVLMVGGPVAAAAASTADAARTTVGAATAARADTDAWGAAQAAVKHYPGTVQSLDKDGSTWHVDVIGKNGKHAEVDVSARTGAATTRNTDDDGDSAKNKKLLAAKYNAQKAIKAAVAVHAGQVWSVEWDDDDDGGAPHWNVAIKSGNKTQNVHVDPTTGKATLSGSDGDGDNGY